MACCCIFPVTILQPGGIGVSNFLKRHLEELRRDLRELKAQGSSSARGLLRTWPPDVVQHEVHLLRREEELVRYCRLWNITVGNSEVFSFWCRKSAGSLKVMSRKFARFLRAWKDCIRLAQRGSLKTPQVRKITYIIKIH